MTPERKEQIRKDCEKEAQRLSMAPPYVLYKYVYSERIKAEELIEAGEALRNDVATLRNQMQEANEDDYAEELNVRVNNWTTALAKYRTP